jgi:hypothetical protein
VHFIYLQTIITLNPGWGTPYGGRNSARGKVSFISVPCPASVCRCGSSERRKTVINQTAERKELLRLLFIIGGTADLEMTCPFASTSPCFSSTHVVLFNDIPPRSITTALYKRQLYPYRIRVTDKGGIFFLTPTPVVRTDLVVTGRSSSTLCAHPPSSTVGISVSGDSRS